MLFGAVGLLKLSAPLAKVLRLVHLGRGKQQGSTLNVNIVELEIQRQLHLTWCQMHSI